MPEKRQCDVITYRPVTLVELVAAAKESPTTLPYLLATKFNYDVNQGGFAQLLFNLQGEFLAEVEEMLIAANSLVAHAYYVRAIAICLENQEECFRFLESNYIDANAVKHALQLLSVEYFQQRKEFADEAAEFFAAQGE
jgi:hypothetical protein